MFSEDMNDGGEGTTKLNKVSPDENSYRGSRRFDDVGHQVRSRTGLRES